MRERDCLAERSRVKDTTTGKCPVWALCKPLKFGGFTVQPNGAILVNSERKFGFTSGKTFTVDGGIYAEDTVYLAVYLKSKNGFELNWLDYWDLLDLFGEQIAEKCHSQYMEN